MNSRVSLLIAIAVLAAALSLVLGHTGKYPFVNFDDPNVIVENPVIEGMGGGNFKAVFTEVRDHAYLPLYYASYWIDYAIGGKDPGIYHRMNLVFHFLASLLLFAFLRQLAVKTLPATIATAVFLLHPAAVESVVWASGRKDVLSGLLMLLALVVFFQKREPGPANRGLVCGSLVFLLALFAKASVFVLPLILLAVYRLNKDKVDEPKVTRPALIASAGIAVFAVGVHLAVASSSGTVGGHIATFGQQVFVMLGAMGRYFINLAAPFSLNLVYDRSAGVGLDGLAITGIILLGVLALNVVRFWKRPTLLSLGILWMFAGLIPFNNIYPRFSGVMADRYLYVSLMGAAVFAAGLMQLARGSMAKRPVQVAIVLAVCGFAVLTHSRSKVWRDSEVLWKDTLDKSPEAILPYLQLGQVYEERALGEEPAKAASMLDAASRLFAQSCELARSPRQLSQALIKVASLEARRGRYENALDAFDRLEKALPDELSEAEENELDHAAVTRASSLAGLGRFDEALKALKRVGSQSTADREARHNRAVVYILVADQQLKTARSDEGRQAAVEAYNKGLLAYREIVELWPDYEVARHDYVNAYIPAVWLKGYHIDVTKMANKLVDDFPDSGRAYYLRARILKEANAGTEAALKDLKVSVGLDPYREEPYLLVVQLLRNTGQNKEAKLVIDLGLKSLPDSSRLKSALCETYVSFGYHHKNTQRLDYAGESAARARAILPDSPAAWQLTAEVAQAEAEMTGNPTKKKDLWIRANDAYEKLHELDPSNAAATLGRAKYHRVKGYAYLYATLPKGLSKEVKRAQRSEIRRQAMEEFLEAVTMAPTAEDFKEIGEQLVSYSGEFRARADDLLELGETARASVEMDKALHFGPKVAENHATVARIAAATHDYAAAERSFEACLKIEPENLRALFELGKLHFDNRKFALAVEPFEKFCKLTEGADRDPLLSIRKSAMKLIETCKAKAAKEDD